VPDFRCGTKPMQSTASGRTLKQPVRLELLAH